MRSCLIPSLVLLLGLANRPVVEARAVQQAKGVSAPAQPPVALPDVSALHPAVQKQMRGAYESLAQELRRSARSPRDRGDIVGQMGMLFMATRFFDEAARCFNDAERSSPADFRWPYYRGHVHKNGGELSAAAESFERARRLRPDDLATLVWLGRAYLDLARPADAEARLLEALSIGSTQAAVRFELGRVAIAKRDYRRAIEHLTSAATLDPESLAVHYPLALAYRGLGDLEKATHHLERRGAQGSRQTSASASVPFPDPLLAALSGIVQTPQLYRERGLDAASVRNWAEAVKHFRLAVEADPAYAAMRVNLGSALEQIGDPRSALAQYEEALRLEPRLAEAHFGLADLLERGGRDADAIEHYRAAATAQPTFTAAHLRLADALRRTDHLEPALDHYRHALALEPADADARFGEAMVFVRLERYADARDRLAQAMQILPDQPMFRQALARVLAAAPDDRVRDGARAWKLVEDVRKEQQHPGAFETLAMVLAELGHFDLAIDWQRLAMTAAARVGRPDVAQRMAASLALYQGRQPRRSPWRLDDPDHRPGPPVNPALLAQAPPK
ncbi:MAG: tetratricopeptide repeat protein [Acidimicrobiia bacterium]|nr:tetratricopeptide repeat protein [Acidimicrobiia bacterium]